MPNLKHLAQEKLNTAYNCSITYDQHVQKAKEVPGWKIFTRLSNWFTGFGLKRKFNNAANEASKTWNEFTQQENFSIKSEERKKLEAVQTMCNSLNKTKVSQRLNNVLNIENTPYFEFGTHKFKQLQSTRALVDSVLAQTQNSTNENDQHIYERYCTYRTRLSQGKSVVLPAYYHMTKNSRNFEGIVKSGKIEVSNEGYDKSAAWVSNFIESEKRFTSKTGFGHLGVALGVNPILHSKKVSSASGNPTCNKENPQKRFWIGIKKPIPVHSKTTAYLIVPDADDHSKINIANLAPTLFAKNLSVVSLSEAKREQELLHKNRPLDVAPKRWKLGI